MTYICAKCNASCQLSDNADVRTFACPACGAVNTVVPGGDARKTQVVQQGRGPSPTATRSGKFGDFHIVEGVDRRPIFKSYIAENLKTSAACVVKILAVKPPADAVLVGRFLDAGKRWMGLRHSNIARVLDFGVVDKIPFISVEYVPGPNNRRLTVASYLKLNQKGRASQNRCIDWARQIATALMEAHKNHIIHGTLRPDNVLINAEGSPVLTDFGLAASLSLQAELGADDKAETASYVAPELRARPVNPDVSCDIYSFGALMYRLLTGKIPADKPASPSTVIAGLNPMWDRIVSICMNPVVGDRYPDADSLAADLAILAEKITGQSEMQEAVVIPDGRPARAPSEINYDGIDATGQATADLKVRRRARQMQVLQRMNPKDSLNAAIIASDAAPLGQSEDDAIIVPDVPPSRSPIDNDGPEAFLPESNCATATLERPTVAMADQSSHGDHAVGQEHDERVEQHENVADEAPTHVGAEHLEEHPDPLASIAQSSGSRRKYFRRGNSSSSHAMKMVVFFFILAAAVLVGAWVLLKGENDDKAQSSRKPPADVTKTNVVVISQTGAGNLDQPVNSAVAVSAAASTEKESNAVSPPPPAPQQPEPPKTIKSGSAVVTKGAFSTLASLPFSASLSDFPGMAKATSNFGSLFKTIRVEWYERQPEPTAKFENVAVEMMKFGFSETSGKLTDVFVRAKGKESYNAILDWARRSLGNEEAIDERMITWTVNFDNSLASVSLKVLVIYDKKADRTILHVSASQ